MHYVIDPKVFYIINLLSKLNMIFCIIFWVTVIMTLLVLFWGCDDIISVLDSKDKNAIADLIKIFKRLVIVLIISFIGFIFIPSEKTCKEMLVASYLTEENIEYGKESIKDAIDYIFEKIENKEDNSSD